MISNPAAKKRVSDSMQEISGSFTRIEAERDLIKNIICDLSEELEINKKLLRKAARAYHKQNLAEEQQQMEEVATLVESIK